MPPRICPSPPEPDCPLYAQRLGYSVDEPLRRAILMERPRSSLGSLVWADFNRQRERPVAPPTRPAPPRPALPEAPEPEPLPVQDHLTQKGATNG
ncbi:MAG TPA: hypothetical protein VFH99_03115 [Candidatus Saccharimonadales bacterium]|nr:hypothetical protein [Candidatus Saccharimonadales bacterium]